MRRPIGLLLGIAVLTTLAVMTMSLDQHYSIGINPARFDLVVEFLASSSQRGRFAPDQRTFPCVPGYAAVRALERAKESVIIEP